MTVRVGLFAPLNDVAAATGTGQYTMNLLSALADLQTEEGDSLPELEYVVMTSDTAADWVPPTIRDRMTIEECRLASRGTRFESTLDDLGIDVVHFLVPVFFRTERATVFNPYDMRHLRYPEHCTTQELDRRRRFYPTGCEQATIVDTLSMAVKDQLVEAYDVDPGKVYPVPMGPALAPGDGAAASADVTDSLPDSFALFPANLWPHKNHERLVDAIQRIEDRYGERVHLVCTGIRDTPEVSAEYRVEGVPDAPQVTDLGFVDAADLRALYRRSRMLVYPTLHEGGGLPVLEAWQFDTPVVCSDIPVLREKGGDAAVYLDPESVPEMADTIHEVWTDAAHREELVERGRDRRDLFTWKRTARAYHALYRKAAGREPGAADAEALTYPPTS
jgi:glycosyltransferase involved in cell wall biosynthesis